MNRSVSTSITSTELSFRFTRIDRHSLVYLSITFNVLTTRMLALSRQGVTRAEAQRQAMMALIDTAPAHNAHPALWAPFVVVGEGGR